MATSNRVSRFFQTLFRWMVWLFAANVLFIILTRWVNTPVTMVMIQSVLQGRGLKRDYITYSEMGRNAKLAVISSEDQLFPDHNGFDWNAIQKAMKYNQNPKHKKIKGASTISQQTAKNVFLWNGRNWLRKGLEVYHTFMIEWIWGKKRILETYLNIAEMGSGVFGIEAASQYYFHKPARQLSKSEAAWIAAVLPSPLRYNIVKPSAFLQRRHSWILNQMNHLDGDPDLVQLLNDE